MITLLNDPKQRNLWMQIYKMMQMRYHIGMLIGLVGYALLSYNMLKINK